ncbi:MAG: S41 family peptidase [Deferribacteraceae bacterium]|jgi:carboxyl-terminal processing protease|nr:S41 family peptidase [Deferribacteraceae bacterium]
MFKGKKFSLSLLVLIVFALFLGISQMQDRSSVYAAKQDDKFNDLENFHQALTIIKNNYVDNISDGALIQGAVKGMLQGLDPHSSYLSPEQYKTFLTDIRGEFGGLGMTIGMRGEAVTVISPIEDTPAARAGIQPGDMIFKIDNTITTGMDSENAAKLMRGQPGTKVVLTIMRKGEDKPLEFTLTREIIKIKSVRYQMMNENIGYIKLNSFQEKSGDEVKKALQDLKKQNSKGIILDLRNNSGGSLSEAVIISSLFLPANKNVVITKDRSNKDTFLTTKSFAYREQGQPLVVLVNEGSASASEIVAGAMQDYGRGVILGTTTFGKASVQTLLELRNGSAMKLTTARYYTPKGRSIQGVGIMPDIVVPQGKIVYSETKFNIKEKDLSGHLVGENEESSVSGAMPTTPETDLQLQSAIQMIKGLSLYERTEK